MRVGWPHLACRLALHLCAPTAHPAPAAAAETQRQDQCVLQCTDTGDNTGD
jgi:hypothetical protein